MKNILQFISAGFFIIFATALYADDDHEEAKRLVESGDILPLENVLKNAREVQSGKVLEVELETEKGKKIYEIELLDTDGTVFELKFDAQTGKHISTEKEN